MNPRALMIALFLAVGCAFFTFTSGGRAADANTNYARPFEPAGRAAFLPLPPGAVEPGGWLRDWCIAARDGYTGHMDDYDVAFKQAWASDHKMTGENLLWYKGAWPYEGGGYWFDGLVRLGYALHDESLIEQAKRRLYAVADNMNTTGMLFLWWLDRKNPENQKAMSAALEGWPLWASGLLGRSMTGFHAASHDKHVLDALEMAYGSDVDCLRDIKGNLSNLWPAFDTYCWTGNPRVAEALDGMFKREGGALLPNLSRYRKAPDLTPGTGVDNAHVVEFLESTTPWLVGYLWTGDKQYLQAAVGWHDLLERVAMQPYGVPVSDEWYGPAGAFRGSETCDVAGYVWSQISLLAVTGQGRMADRLERAFFNAGPATVSRDFKTHVYFQSPNRFADQSPDFPHGPRGGGGSYQAKHSPLCCSAALNRVVPWFVTHMWMATPDNGLVAACYGPSKVTALVADHVPVTIVCKTDYPFNETIDLTVDPARVATFPLEFHIPGWCTAPMLTLNGARLEIAANADGFVRLARAWKAGDTVQLRFPMTAQVVRGRDTASGPPYDGAHRVTPVTVPDPGSMRGVPFAAVSYGPLLFSLPIADTTDANTPDPAARWRFALDVQDPQIRVERGAMPSRWDWPLNAPLKLKIHAVEATSWQPDPRVPSLPRFPVARGRAAEDVTLVPYGCTKFRISMFPVTQEPEVKSSAIRRVLFLGNSITLHGPKADIGWTGNWGMAASSEDKDYVHLVAAALKEHTGTAPQILVRNVADFERDYVGYDADTQLKDSCAFDPDLVVLAIGENVPALATDDAKARFKSGVLSILRCAMARRHPMVVVRSSFWPDAGKDQMLKEAAEQAGVIFVDAGPLGRDEANAARSERKIDHAGVAAHPGDRGMKALAELVTRAVVQRSIASNALPGRGVLQHPFLYAGEWDTRKPLEQSIFVVRDGKVAWQYTMPLRTASGGVQEFDDATLLSNGNIIFSRMSGAGMLSPEKKMLWEYPAPTGTEIHSCQSIGKDRVLLMRNGNPAQAMIVDTASGKVEREIPIPTKVTGTHGQFRHIRMTKAGTLLVPHLGENKVVEYDLDGKALWSVEAKSPWHAVRLKTGNTLIAGDWSRYAREVNPKGETVWEFTQADLPGFKMGNVQTACRLANGNTVLCLWIAGDNDASHWPGTVQVLEVTPAKQVVWALSSWSDPDLGPATSIQLLDEPGAPEDQER